MWPLEVKEEYFTFRSPELKPHLQFNAMPWTPPFRLLTFCCQRILRPTYRVGHFWINFPKRRPCIMCPRGFLLKNYSLHSDVLIDTLNVSLSVFGLLSSSLLFTIFRPICPSAFFRCIVSNRESTQNRTLYLIHGWGLTPLTMTGYSKYSLLSNWSWDWTGNLQIISLCRLHLCKWIRPLQMGPHVGPGAWGRNFGGWAILDLETEWSCDMQNTTLAPTGLDVWQADFINRLVTSSPSIYV